MSPAPLARLAGAAFLALAALPVGAQTVAGDRVVYDRAPTLDELRLIFGIDEPAAPESDATGKRTRSLTRGIAFHDSPAAAAPAGAASGARTARAATPRRQPEPKLPPLPKEVLDIAIGFELDSDLLAASEERKLETLGQFMIEQPELSFLIAGHADETGSRAHNFGLSKRRAARVRAYFVEGWGIAPERLDFAGYGETVPLPDRPGDDPLNRRVEFRLIR